MWGSQRKARGHRADLDDLETNASADAFGAPVIIDARVRDGSLREAVAEKGIPMLLYEAGEALRFNETAIKVGIRGIVSVMREIGIIKTRVLKRLPIKPLVVRVTKWVRAPISRILHSTVPLGSRVLKKDVLGVVGDPFGEVE